MEGILIFDLCLVRNEVNKKTSTLPEIHFILLTDHSSNTFKISWVINLIITVILTLVTENGGPACHRTPVERDDIMFPGGKRKAICFNLGSYFALEDGIIKPLELVCPAFLQLWMRRWVSVLIAITVWLMLSFVCPHDEGPDKFIFVFLDNYTKWRRTIKMIFHGCHGIILLAVG